MIPNGPGACSPARPLPSLGPRDTAIGRLVLRGVAEADYHKPTVCSEFDMTQLADHLAGPDVGLHH
jgi:hypothetical protein